MPKAHSLLLLQITSPEFEVDTFFPQIDPHSFKLDSSYPEQGKAHEEKGVTYEVSTCSHLLLKKRPKS